MDQPGGGSAWRKLGGHVTVVCSLGKKGVICMGNEIPFTVHRTCTLYFLPAVGDGAILVIAVGILNNACRVWNVYVESRISCVRLSNHGA
jgi:hypothetical protein